MRKVNFFKVKGTLIQASHSDFFDRNGEFIEEKIFFIKDYITREFTSTYKISSINSQHKDVIQLALENYVKQEVSFLLKNKLVYKLSENHHELDYHFELVLKTADFYDLFFNSNWLKVNSCYYIMNKASSLLTGPYFLNENDDKAKMGQYIAQEIIYVPIKKQLFEKTTMKKTA